MPAINLHHLRYFRAVAHAGGLTRAAAQLRLSPSALSVQLRALEESLGHALFERVGRRLVLTEAGRIALDHADTIAASAEALRGKLSGRAGERREVLRIGAIATLSRNFQLAFVRPLLDRDDVELVLRSGTMRELLTRLEAHELDAVLTNMAVARDAARPWHSHRIAEQQVSLVGPPPRKRGGGARFRFPADLDGQRLILPGAESSIREAFDRLLERTGIHPAIIAEVDDMAMMRVLVRESGALALVPPIVVQDELASGALVERARVPDITESFYAVTRGRRFPNPLLASLIPA